MVAFAFTSLDVYCLHAFIIYFVELLVFNSIP